MKRTVWTALLAALALTVTVTPVANAALLPRPPNIQQIIARATSPSSPPQPLPTTALGGVIDTPTGTHPPPNLVGHVQLNGGDHSCLIPIGPGAQANHDFRMPGFGCTNDDITGVQATDVRQTFPQDFATSPKISRGRANRTDGSAEWVCGAGGGVRRVRRRVPR
jgi:hypothetical protein